MFGSSKLNRHPACSCDSCRRGSATTAGQEVHKAVNRRIRRNDSRALKEILKGADPEDFEDSIESTPYTD